MNTYDAEDVKRAVKLSRFFKDEGCHVSSNGSRCVATWRGGERDSVSIDDAAGVWCDHADGDKGGDVITAYQRIHGGTPASAIQALGDRYNVPPTKTHGASDGAGCWRRVATYDYVDEHGAYLYSVERKERKSADGSHDKKFTQRRGDNYKLGDVRRVLYNLPAVLAASSVFVVEGEKDVETLRKMGIVATTNSGGADQWREEFNAVLAGREVVIIEDNDKAGREHAHKVAAGVRGVAKSVKVLKISRLPKGDVTDWLEKEGGTLEKLKQLVADAPEYNPLEAAAVERQAERFSLADVPEYVPEEQDPNILIKGRWLERGGSAFIVSTAGTGKSILSIQMALCFAEGRPFAGLAPLRPLRLWIFQTEDSISRLSIDRSDITAELAEQMPEVDWKKTWAKIVFFRILGKVGAKFLSALDERLANEPPDGKPDAVMLNPLMSFIGGQVTDGTFVTPFLRGGEINRQDTPGLQFILETHGIGVICFHHTPKPPSPNELKAWLRSPFPEYQGGGAADITNWGRSFITMMRVPDKPNVVCLTAGKNGAELGWELVDGAYRRYIAWSNQTGVTGKNRHAWREVDADELSELTADARLKLKADVEMLVEKLKTSPMTWGQARDAKPAEMTFRRFEAAWKDITTNAERYGLSGVEVPTTAKKKPVFWGLPEAAASAANTAFQNWKNATSPQTHTHSQPTHMSGSFF